MCLFHARLVDAADAAEEILRESYGVQLVKAINPLTDVGFLRIVNTLSRKLNSIAGPVEAKHVKQAIEKLDVDWPNITPDQRKRVVQAANLALRPIPKAVVPKITKTLKVEGEQLVKGTRVAVKRTFKLNISADFSATDKRIAHHVASSQAFYVTDQYGKRRERFSATARDVVAASLEQGLRRDEISERLAKVVTGTTMSRSKAYYDVIASTYANRARTYAELNQFQEAGIDEYEISAVLDEATTDICRMLAGTRFPVDNGLSVYDKVEAATDPEAVKDLQPWVRAKKNKAGKVELFVEQNNRKTVVGVVERSGRGKVDDTGRFASVLGRAGLINVGITMPPFHGHCRTTIVPA